MLALFGAVALLAPVNVAQADLINGSFETGDFGWTKVAISGAFGSWGPFAEDAFLSSGVLAPAPTDGTFQAISNSPGDDTTVLYQEFVVPANGVLEFDYWWNNQHTEWINNGTLNIDTANQYARVDLMMSGTDPFSTSPGDTLLNILTLVSGPLQGGYEHALADISAFVGQTVRFRAASASSEFFLHLGIDHVTVTPAPSALTVLAIGGLLSRCRRH